jgi:hypothetical protein
LTPFSSSPRRYSKIPELRVLMGGTAELEDDDEDNVEPLKDEDKIPVTLITGFLGSGKTTLVNRILTVLICRTELVLTVCIDTPYRTVLTFCTVLTLLAEFVCTVLMFLTEPVLAVLIFLIFFTEIVFSDEPVRHFPTIFCYLRFCNPNITAVKLEPSCASRYTPIPLCSYIPFRYDCHCCQPQYLSPPPPARLRCQLLRTRSR